MFTPMMSLMEFDQRTLEEQLIARKRDLENRIAAVDKALTMLHDNPELQNTFLISKAIMASTL